MGLLKVEGSAAATGFPAGVGLACIPNGCPFLPFGSWSDSKTKVGWTAGFGIERVIGNDHWTVKFEYLYVDLGTVGTTFATPAGCYGNGKTPLRLRKHCCWQRNDKHSGD